MIGHGTDHPAWTSYMAMGGMLRNAGGPGVYMGIIEGEWLSSEEIRDKVL